MSNRPGSPPPNGGWFPPENKADGEAAAARRAAEQQPPPVFPTDAEPETPGGWYVPREAVERVSAILFNANATPPISAEPIQPAAELTPAEPTGNLPAAQTPAPVPPPAPAQTLPPGATLSTEADYSNYVPGVGFVTSPPADSQAVAASAPPPVPPPAQEAPIEIATQTAPVGPDIEMSQGVAITDTPAGKAAEAQQPATPVAPLSQQAAPPPAASQPAASQGVNVTSTENMPQRFLDVEAKVRVLRRRYNAGGITKDQLKQELKALMIEDKSAGVWWMVGLETDGWYKFDGTKGQWVLADPPYLPPRPKPEASAPMPPAASAPAPAVGISANVRPAPAPTPIPKPAPIADDQGTVVGRWAARLDSEQQRTVPNTPNRNAELTQPNPAVSGVTVANPALANPPAAGSGIPSPTPKIGVGAKESLQPDYGAPQQDLLSDRQRTGGCLIRGTLVLTFAFLAVSLVAVIGAIVFYFSIVGRYEQQIVNLAANVAADPQSVQIFDASGRLIYQLNDPNTGARRQVALSEISPYLIHATVATEDQRFYQNPGFDIIGITRAILQNLAASDTVSGASSITQQLTRMKVLDPGASSDRSVGRKITEIIVSSEIARRYSKSQILEYYLNSIYYGNLAYGVEAAARTYFKKPAKDLTLSEASFLAGLVQAPATYDPAQRPIQGQDPLWWPRMQDVQRLMVEAGCIPMQHAPYDQAPFCVVENAGSPTELPSSINGTVAERALVFATMVSFRPAANQITYPHFVVYVQQQLEAAYGRDALYTSGFNVYTTIDPRIQDAAQQIVKQQVEALRNLNVGNGAVLVLRPSDGAILGMVGSIDFNNKDIDGQVNVTTSARQPGSTLKPFVYLAAMERDTVNKYYTPGTVIYDVRTCYGTSAQPYCPQNYDRRFNGPLSLRSSLARSLNVPAVKTLATIGIERFKAIADRVGIQFPLQPVEAAGLTAVLGGAETTLMSLTKAYAVLANNGRRVEPFAIARITRDVAGTEEVVYQASVGEAPQVVEPGLAYLITNILSDDGARAPSFGANSALQLKNGHTAAVKTGTTTDNKDNWTVGYTPDFVVGVWVGNTRGQPMSSQATGLTGAAPIWNAIMTVATSNVQAKPFTPVNVQQATICADYGTLDFPECRNRRPEIFFAANPPPGADTVFRQVQIDSFTGMLANENCPENVVTAVALNIEDPSALAWLNNDPAGQRWAQQRGLTLPIRQIPTAACTPGMARPNVKVNSPTPGGTVFGIVQVFGTISMPNFARYQLEVGQGQNPASYERVDGPYGAPPAGDNVFLGRWDASTILQGIYTLRLVVYDAEGRFVEVKIPVQISPNVVPTVDPFGGGGFPTQPPLFPTQPSLFPTTDPFGGGGFSFPTPTPITIDPFGATPTAPSLFPPTQGP